MRADEQAANLGGRDLGLVERDEGHEGADAPACDEAGDDEHGVGNGAGLEAAVRSVSGMFVGSRMVRMYPPTIVMMEFKKMAFRRPHCTQGKSQTYASL